MEIPRSRNKREENRQRQAEQNLQLILRVGVKRQNNFEFSKPDDWEGGAVMTLVKGTAVIWNKNGERGVITALWIYVEITTKHLQFICKAPKEKFQECDFNARHIRCREKLKPREEGERAEESWVKPLGILMFWENINKAMPVKHNKKFTRVVFMKSRGKFVEISNPWGQIFRKVKDDEEQKPPIRFNNNRV